MKDSARGPLSVCDCSAERPPAAAAERLLGGGERRQRGRGREERERGEEKRREREQREKRRVTAAAVCHPLLSLLLLLLLLLCGGASLRQCGRATSCRTARSSLLHGGSAAETSKAQREREASCDPPRMTRLPSRCLGPGASGPWSPSPFLLRRRGGLRHARMRLLARSASRGRRLAPALCVWRERGLCAGCRSPDLTNGGVPSPASRAKREMRRRRLLPALPPCARAVLPCAPL